MRIRRGCFRPCPFLHRLVFRGDRFSDRLCARHDYCAAQIHLGSNVRARFLGACAITGAPPRLRLTRDNVQLLQPSPEGGGWMFGTEVATGWSLPREGLPSQVDADDPRLARWAKFRRTMRDASSEPGCSRDQEQPHPDDDSSDGSCDLLTGRCETFGRDGCGRDRHRTQIHDPDDE